tara:strand:- start:154 stop:504 length:351 start_codon:yes stop_codon:yes gene_type:complete
MKRTVTENDFVRAFDEMGREFNFTHPARVALYEYLTEMERIHGEEIELDVIALCSDFTEYETVDELIEAYYHEDDEKPEYLEDVALMLEDETLVIRVDYFNHATRQHFESLIVQDF